MVRRRRRDLSHVNHALRPHRRQQRGGRESEEYAKRLCVELHEQHLSGQQQRVPSGAWAGGVLIQAFERAGDVTAECALLAAHAPANHNTAAATLDARFVDISHVQSVMLHTKITPMRTL